MKATHKAQPRLLGTALVIPLLAVLAPKIRAQSTWVVRWWIQPLALSATLPWRLTQQVAPTLRITLLHPTSCAMRARTAAPGAACDQAHALAAQPGTTQKTMPTLTPEPCAAILPLL